MALQQDTIDRIIQSEKVLREHLEKKDTQMQHSEYIPENPYGVLEYIAAAHAHAYIASIIIQRELG